MTGSVTACFSGSYNPFWMIGEGDFKIKVIRQDLPWTLDIQVPLLCFMSPSLSLYSRSDGKPENNSGEPCGRFSAVIRIELKPLLLSDIEQAGVSDPRRAAAACKFIKSTAARAVLRDRGRSQRCPNGKGSPPYCACRFDVQHGQHACNDPPNAS